MNLVFNEKVGRPPPERLRNGAEYTLSSQRCYCEVTKVPLSSQRPFCENTSDTLSPQRCY